MYQNYKFPQLEHVLLSIFFYVEVLLDVWEISEVQKSLVSEVNSMLDGMPTGCALVVEELFHLKPSGFYYVPLAFQVSYARV